VRGAAGNRRPYRDFQFPGFQLPPHRQWRRAELCAGAWWAASESAHSSVTKLREEVAVMKRLNRAPRLRL